MWYAVFQNRDNPANIILSTVESQAAWHIAQKVKINQKEIVIYYERIGNSFEAKSFEQATKKWRNYIFRVLPINARLG